MSQRLKSPTHWSESTRYQASHSPNSSSHWNNQYAHRLSTVRKPPPTGGKHPRTGLQTSQNLQSLEELVRWQVYQHPNPSTHWNNPPVHGPLRGTKHPVGGAIRPLTGISASKKLQWVEEGNPREYEKSPFREPHEGHGRKTPTQPTGTKAFRAPREANTKRQTKKGVPGA